MVLMKQLNFDVCDMINKVCIEDHKRQKIIDDYEIFINGKISGVQLPVAIKMICLRSSKMLKII